MDTPVTTVNQESGHTPYGNYGSTLEPSEHAQGPHIDTHPGFNTGADSAVVHPHQNVGDTQKIGVPGSEYASHVDDHIISFGGNHIILGGDPSNPVIRLQSKDGSAIELGANGIKFVSAAGIHMSAGGDIHMVNGGDLSVTSSGDHKMKATAHYSDTNQYHVSTGDHLLTVQGDHNEHVFGDKHSIVGLDSSVIRGGDHRETTAGSVTHQVAGNSSEHVSGKKNTLVADDHHSSTEGHYSMKSGKSFAMGAKGKMAVMSEDDMSHHTLGASEHVSKGDMTHSTKGSKHTMAQGDHIENVGGAHNKAVGGVVAYNYAGTFDVSSRGSMSLSSSSVGTIKLTTPTLEAHAGALKMLASGSITTSTPQTFASPSVGSVISAIIPDLAPKTQNNERPKQPEVKIKNDKTTVPKPEDILDIVSHLHKTKVEHFVSNSEDMYKKYSDEGEGDPPDEVIAKLKELGDVWPIQSTSEAIT